MIIDQLEAFPSLPLPSKIIVKKCAKTVHTINIASWPMIVVANMAAPTLLDYLHFLNFLHTFPPLVMV
jgi:hypothetical protein